MAERKSSCWLLLLLLIVLSSSVFNLCCARKSPKVIVTDVIEPPIYEEVPKPATAPKGWLEKTVMSKIAMAAELPKKTPDWILNLFPFPGEAIYTNVEEDPGKKK